ncbi:nucleotide exchange factor GrpE [Buchnera aphidicola (Ceratovacuna keduensis)]|uniref:nucleotide exchange factor GrpE n=1 Tax=Buchnera aphidicola TaxID=9 RepID=UPI0031B88551
MKKKHKISLKNKIKILKLEKKELLLKHKKILIKIKKLYKEILEKKINIKKNLERNIKRLNLELENSYKFSLEKVIIEILPIIDSIEIAIKLKNNIKNILIKNFLIKLENILNSFIKLLNKFKVFEIKDINIKFDPNIHQAISINYSKKIENNFVVNIVQKGYLLHKRLLRPAMVIVNKKLK